MRVRPRLIPGDVADPVNDSVFWATCLPQKRRKEKE